jgi:TonB family protein
MWASPSNAQEQPDAGPTSGAEAPAVKAVVPPKLLHAEPPVYPAEAERNGLEGEVLMRLTIDKEGHVTEVDVVEPAGNGFDPAAADAAKKFLFSPATRDGEPVSVKILYRLSFPRKTAAQTPVAAPSLGELAGALRIAGTDAPLAGARVEVVGPDGSHHNTQSDAEGRWRLQALPPGSHQVNIQAEGFESLHMAEVVRGGEAAEVTYRMRVKSERSEGLVVTVVGERPPREVTRRTLERREIERIPGTNGDALRSVLSLPGVARPPALLGLFIVRGSAPQDSATFIDGEQVPIIYHFGGISSVVPTELLERIDFYPGSFSAKYGRQMGGIIDVGLRAPDTDCKVFGNPNGEQGCYHAMAQFDLIDMRAMAQGPIGPLKNWSFAVAGRRSWVDTWLKPVLKGLGAGVTTAPVYYDGQLILSHKPTRDSELRLQSYVSDDRLEILINDPFAQDPGFGGNLTFRTGFYRVQAIYQVKLSREVELRTMSSAGRSHLEFSLGNFLFDLKYYPVSLRSEFGWKVARQVTLNAGYDFQIAPFELNVRAPPPPRPGEPSAGPFSTRPLLQQHNSATAFRPGWYTELELTPTRRARIVPAARVDYARDSGRADFSPRLNARYNLIDSNDAAPGQSRLRTTVKAGVGLFQQPPQFLETDTVFGTPGLRSNRAIHYSLGGEQEFSQNVELSVEGFYKDLTRLVVRNPTLGGYVYTNQGSGYSMGLETMLKYKPDEHFFGWLSYTLSRSVRRNGPDDPEYLFQFDQTHNFTILGSYKLGRGWEFGARFRVISGSLDTLVLGPPALPSLYDADAGAYTPLEGRPSSHRLPLFHQLDLRTDKGWQFKNWRFSLYLDIQNAYNNQAVEALVYNYNFSQQSYQRGLPLIPSIGMRGEF